MDKTPDDVRETNLAALGKLIKNYLEAGGPAIEGLEILPRLMLAYRLMCEEATGVEGFYDAT